MGNRFRIDVKSPVGKVKRVLRACEERDEGMVDFFWALFTMYEYNPQMFNARLRDKLLRFSNLYGKDIQTLVEMAIDEFRENNPVEFTFDGKER